MKNRIKEVMDYKGMSQITFANFIGISPASLSSIFNGRTRPTLNIVEAIKAKIPEISTDWLLFGTGSMLGAEAPEGLNHPTDSEPAAAAATPVPAHPDIKPASKPETPKEEQLLDFEPYEAERDKTNVVKILDKHQRKISEIRVYYDDQTFESFGPVSN